MIKKVSEVGSKIDKKIGVKIVSNDTHLLAITANAYTAPLSH